MSVADDRKQAGAELRRLRERNKWSQAELADAINAALGKTYSSATISPWETGRRTIPQDVAIFLDELAVSTSLPPSGEGESHPLAGAPDGAVAADEAPGVPGGGSEPPARPGAPGPPTGGTWARACTEMWQIIASGVGMVGAATGSQALMVDGAIIQEDSAKLGEAWGRLAETNETFRRMLVGMTEGGAWLQVALVTGTTVSRCYQSHAQLAIAAPAYASNGNGGGFDGDEPTA